MIARAIAWLAIVSLPLVMVRAAPSPFTLRVVDGHATPIEAARVRVVRSHDRYDRVDLYTDIYGSVRSELSGVHKLLDVEINGRPGGYAVSSHRCPGNSTGLNYSTEYLCTLPRSRWSATDLEVVLESRMPTRAICRLTGRGSATKPYTYAGQDSAITVSELERGDTGRRPKLLWWFGDSVDDLAGWILVQNKLATSDADSDASHCPRLEYDGGYASAALPVAPDGVESDWSAHSILPPARRRLTNGMTIEAEDTVWLDVPLVVPGLHHDFGVEAFGQSVFQPDAGDILYASYLSVRDMPELFRINHVGLAVFSECYPHCASRVGRDSRFHRLPEPLWFGPGERLRAPEGTALIDGDDYLIFKVPSRRTYCAAPPYAVDCVSGRLCDDGSRCIEPGKFCSQRPYTACHVSSDCDEGECIPGGVTVMRVARGMVLDKSAYRYWDARRQSFVYDSGRDPDAIIVDSELGNSVSIQWSTYLQRWLMIFNYDRSFFTGQIEVAMRTARSLMGPWSASQTIMQNLSGQKSYNPRFVPAYTKPAPADNLVYWTATYSSFGEREPTYHLPFDYNVFLYETDLANLRQD